MTDPIDGDASATAETGPDQAPTPEKNSDNANKTLVRCHGMVSEFKSNDESFPTVTPKGVHMNDDQLKAAKSAAKACRMKLSTDRGQR